MDFSIYKDIKNRTNGEIYIGVVGPCQNRKINIYKEFHEFSNYSKHKR